MNDREFLIWLHERLEKVHGEDACFDYMHKLRAIIKDTPADRLTPNMGTGNNLNALRALANAQGETYRITRSGECVTFERLGVYNRTGGGQK